MSPVNVWIEELDVNQHIDAARGLDLTTEEGAARFEQVKEAVCTELRKSRHYRTDEQLQQLRSNPRTNERGEGLVLARLIRDLKEAGSVEQFDREMKYVYLWGNDRRVWLGG
ncbi:hypothetical protein [Streptomyces sp. WZ-12]|uniref:hypothetical protein n=1 Tax=Streptomyces sp. WZ-12 TaxID=3030210 RepID=UPI0023810E90|nr:hypothetical protein [Streptomyces sp. WZ-12]